MPHDDLDDRQIADILSPPKRIALVGASANVARPSHGVMRFLLGRGFEVVPVNPGLAGQELLGRPVVATLADVAGPVDIVDVFRRSEDVQAVVDEAVALPRRPGVLWLQLGIWNEGAVATARRAGMTVVVNRCPAIEMPRLRL